MVSVSVRVSSVRGFSVTRRAGVALPWPEEGATSAHVASDLAVHAQFAPVVSVNVNCPPPDGTDAGTFVAVIAHVDGTGSFGDGDGAGLDGPVGEPGASAPCPQAEIASITANDATGFSSRGIMA
jgi:hypothetical protein